MIAIKEKKRKGKKKKVKKSILPLYPPQGEMEDAEIIFFLKIPIQTNRLNRLFIPPDEFNTICQLSNNGEIGHPIWTIIQAAERGGARLHSPGKYIISELKKAIKK